MTFALQTTAADLENLLAERRPVRFGVAWEGEFIYPDYAGLSLRNVPHSIADLLGAPLPNPHTLAEAVWNGEDVNTVRRVVLFLSDGLGYRQLQHLAAEDEEIYDLVAGISGGRGFVPLTSTLPSTTAVALPTLWTGAPPGVSGMVGTTFYLRHYSTMANMLRFGPAIGQTPRGAFEHWGTLPEDFNPIPGLAEHLTANGIPTHLLLPKDMLGTGLSRILHRGVADENRYKHLGYSDLWLRLRDILRQTAGERAYVHAYWHPVDSLMHAYGRDNAYVRAEIKQQLRRLSELLQDEASQDGQTLFILMADHGHHDVPQAYNLAQEPSAAPIWDGMRSATGGDTRMVYVYLRDGYGQRVRDHIREHLHDRFVALTVDEALAAGLYGPVGDLHPDTARRLGDLILIPRLNWHILDPSLRIPSFISTHAGLSDWEMLVPFVWTRF